MKSTPGRPMPPGEKITALRPWPVASITEAPAPAPRTWVLGKTKSRSGARPCSPRGLEWREPLCGNELRVEGAQRLHGHRGRLVEPDACVPVSTIERLDVKRYVAMAGAGAPRGGRRSVERC